MTRSSRKPDKTIDPRKNPQSGSKRPNKPNKKIDRVSLALGASALVLLILVLVFFNRRISDTTISSAAQPPVIERVENQSETQKPKEPLVDLGTPENPPPEAPAAVEPEAAPSAVVEETTARLFFVRVNDEGQISMKSILRPVPVSASPLTMAINSLLDGPRPGELSNDVLSLVPEGSRMIAARVENGTAWLDFNENFRFNSLGIEGYRAQVEQVVYTATEFPTVDKVQFLIEGQRIDYLGGEGFWVGSPLGRDDF